MFIIEEDDKAFKMIYKVYSKPLSRPENHE